MALTGIDVSDRGIVLFDFDGTLANTIDGIVRTARTVLLAHGFAEDELGDLRRLVGPPFPQAYSMVYGVSPEEAASITADYRAIYEGLGLEAWPLYEGIRELLVDLKQAGKKIAVTSSKRTALMLRATSEEGIGELFDLRLGKENDATDTKAATIGRALAAFGAVADDAVMVGDRLFDVEAAAACGMPCIGVHYGNTCPVEELVDAGACAVAETIDELRGLLLV